MARWLAARGHRITMLMYDEGQSSDEVIDKVQIIKLYRRDEGLPGLRFFHPRWTGLLKGLARANADAYYHNTAEYVTGQVALWCRWRQKRFVFSIAHDANCDPRLPNLARLRERLLYRYGLLHADRVISQTLKQQRMLVDAFNVPSTVIPMPCPLPRHPFVGRADRPNPPRVLWVGRITAYKRLEMLLDIAQQAPELMFDIAGVSSEGSDYGRRVAARAAAMPNVVMHGRVPRDRIPELYRRALCLCCTATQEGFPNTFLEAWSEGTPLVTTFDPDHLVAQHGLGGVGANAGELLEAIRRLGGSTDAWATASENARRHFLTTYDPEVVMPQFERVFVEATAGAPDSARSAV